MPLLVSKEYSRLLQGLQSIAIKKPSEEIITEAPFVLGCDETHYNEMKGAIASVQHHFPQASIYFYDLGLTNEQSKEVSVLQLVIISRAGKGQDGCICYMGTMP